MDENSIEFRAASMSIKAAMDVSELMAVGLTKEQAELEMCRRVYGEDVKFARDGSPIEQGIGSAAWLAKNPKLAERHFAYIDRFEGASAGAAAREAFERASR
jgi:hypothetical protein